MFVMDADPAIIKWLKEEGKLYKKEPVLHNYPHCWRCKSPVIFRATEQWFVKVEGSDLREKTLEALKNEKGIS